MQIIGLLILIVLCINNVHVNADVALPTGQPTCIPTSMPSGQPTCIPTGMPSDHPTVSPTAVPTISPTGQPSGQPTCVPSGQPSGQPTCVPSGQPTCVPSGRPSGQPTRIPTSMPSGQPTRIPTSMPSGQPTSAPTPGPTRRRPGNNADNTYVIIGGLLGTLAVVGTAYVAVNNSSNSDHEIDATIAEQHNIFADGVELQTAPVRTYIQNALVRARIPILDSSSNRVINTWSSSEYRITQIIVGSTVSANIYYLSKNGDPVIDSDGLLHKFKYRDIMPWNSI